MSAYCVLRAVLKLRGNAFVKLVEVVVAIECQVFSLASEYLI